MFELFNPHAQDINIHFNCNISKQSQWECFVSFHQQMIHNIGV